VSAFAELVEVQQSLTDSRVENTVVGEPPVKHKVRIPSLIEQLYAAAFDPSMHAEEGGSRVKPRSKPPVAIEAMSRFQDIDKAVRRWVRSVRVEEHVQLDRNIRELVTAAAGQRGYLAWDSETIEALLLEMRQWRRWAAVLTGWESRAWQPRIKCPVCEGKSTIWVSDALRTAYCSACLFTWEDAMELAEQVAA
jgi:hypothetical protein